MSHWENPYRETDRYGEVKLDPETMRMVHFDSNITEERKKYCFHSESPVRQLLNLGSRWKVLEPLIQLEPVSGPREHRRTSETQLTKICVNWIPESFNRTKEKSKNNRFQSLMAQIKHEQPERKEHKKEHRNNSSLKLQNILLRAALSNKVCHCNVN